MALQKCLGSEMGRVAIAGTGFLADGYDLFIIGMVEIILEREYIESGKVTKEEYARDKGTMASAALAGAVLGQVFFGTLADRIGRRAVFIVTAVLIIVGSLGSAVAQEDLFGAGARDVFAQIAIARFVMGFGIGGEYPLSASIASEGCTKRRSGTLMCLVFSNQGWGYLLSCIVMLTLVGAGCTLEFTWRFALAFGAVVPLCALPFRMLMHESQDFSKVQKQRKANAEGVDAVASMKKYSWHVVGTAVNWFLWDIVWYANGLFSQDISDVLSCFGPGIMGVLWKKTIIVMCMLPGFIFSIALLNRFGRKNIQILGYVATGVLFVICGVGYERMKDDVPGLFFALYAATFFFANFGPNTTTYVIPGEIFPSQIKATFHGFSAAMGKMGAVVGAEGFPLLQPKEHHGKVVCLLVCAIISMAGALFTVFFTPRYAAELLEPQLKEETVGFVPLRWQRRERLNQLEAARTEVRGAEAEASEAEEEEQEEEESSGTESAC